MRDLIRQTLRTLTRMAIGSELAARVDRRWRWRWSSWLAQSSPFRPVLASPFAIVSCRMASNRVPAVNFSFISADVSLRLNSPKAATMQPHVRPVNKVECSWVKPQSRFLPFPTLPIDFTVHISEHGQPLSQFCTSNRFIFSNNTILPVNAHATIGNVVQCHAAFTYMRKM